MSADPTTPREDTHMTTEPTQPLTEDGPLSEETIAQARELVQTADLPPGSLNTAVSLLEDMVDEVGRLRAENTAQAEQIAAVLDVITPKNPDWKPLTERHPEYFPPETPEETARKKGWRQGEELLTSRIRHALGVGDSEKGETDA